MTTSKLSMSLDDIIAMNSGGETTDPKTNTKTNTKRTFDRATQGQRWKNRQVEKGAVEKRSVRGASATIDASKAVDYALAEREDRSSKFTRIMIYNISSSTTEGDIYDLCKRFGDIKKVSLLYDDRKQMMHMVQVTFFSSTVSIAAKTALDGVCFNGRRVTVQMAP